MAEKNDQAGSGLDGIIAGIIDVHYILTLLVMKAIGADPEAMAKIFTVTLREELPGRSAEYIEGRRYVAKHISQTLRDLATSTAADHPAKRGRVNFTLLPGGLASGLDGIGGLGAEDWNGSGAEGACKDTQNACGGEGEN